MSIRSVGEAGGNQVAGELEQGRQGGRSKMSERGRQSGGKKILVVDDEVAVRELCSACIIFGLGDDWQVVQAADGREAIAKAEQEQPDLILLDIMMPEVDGFEVCKKLKASPKTGAIPVVFLTALGAEKDVERGLALGGDGYVVKPFNAVTLVAQISELLTASSEDAD